MAGILTTLKGPLPPYSIPHPQPHLLSFLFLPSLLPSPTCFLAFNLSYTPRVVLGARHLCWVPGGLRMGAPSYDSAGSFPTQGAVGVTCTALSQLRTQTPALGCQEEHFEG